MGKHLYLLLVLILGLAGCVVSPLRNGTTTTTTTAGGKLYVSTAGSILRFGNALSANTSVSPEVIISGTTSQLNSPKRIFVDTTTDRLFVANAGASSVLIFSPASTATATSTPSAVLTSSGNMTTPIDLAIDPNNNLLYVADSSNNTILVFTGESALNGATNVVPARTMTLSFNIAAIFLDVANNNLFIVDQTDNFVGILQNASLQSGQVTSLVLAAQIGGPTSTLSAPDGVVLDSNRRPIISNGSPTPSILIFPSLVVPGGGQNVAPNVTISGTSTRVGLPGHMVFNPSQNNGELYVADNQAPGILIFTNINQVGLNGGNVSITSAPARSIIGSGTQLSAGAINGVALDTTR